MGLVGGRSGGLTVGVLHPGASGPGSSPSQGHCVVFLGKTLNSHSASLHPGVYRVRTLFCGQNSRLIPDHFFIFQTAGNSEILHNLRRNNCFNY